MMSFNLDYFRFAITTLTVATCLGLTHPHSWVLLGDQFVNGLQTSHLSSLFCNLSRIFPPPSNYAQYLCLTLGRVRNRVWQPPT
jgi:hypothetical protein